MAIGGLRVVRGDGIVRQRQALLQVQRAMATTDSRLRASGQPHTYHVVTLTITGTTAARTRGEHRSGGGHA